MRGFARQLRDLASQIIYQLPPIQQGEVGSNAESIHRDFLFGKILNL